MGLERSHALWLARGAAFGALVQRLRRQLRAGLSRLRDLGFAGRGLPRGP